MIAVTIIIGFLCHVNVVYSLYINRPSMDLIINTEVIHTAKVKYENFFIVEKS